MTAVLVAFLCLFSGASGALIAWSVTHEAVGTILRDRVRSVVVVTLKTGEAYRGVLWDADHHALVLRNAHALAHGGERIVVDGELLVLRTDVAYMQRP